MSEERLSVEDQAQRQSERFLEQALAAHAERAARAMGGPGRCRNCGEACLPLAVYCDADCRADHERRASTLARAGTSLGSGAPWRKT